MKFWMFLWCAVVCYHFPAQNSSSSSTEKNKWLHKLSNGDSLVYYQCHIEAAEQELKTASGHTLNSVAKNLSITEKFVLYKLNNVYTLTHYVSVLTMCPNRRFSGLKFREKAYWEFFYKESKALFDKDLQILTAIENIGKEANEYDFAISTENSNQVIILGGTKAKQLGLPKGILLSKVFKD
jgi:hypothetical protein